MLRISTPAGPFRGRIEVVPTTNWKLPLGLRSIQLPAKLRPSAWASCFSCCAWRRSIFRYWDNWAEVRPRSCCIADLITGAIPVSDEDGAADAAIAIAIAIGENTSRPRWARETNLCIDILLPDEGSQDLRGGAATWIAADGPGS